MDRLPRTFVDIPCTRCYLFAAFNEEIQNDMSSLGRKYTCYSCHTKFYDLGKPVPLCPKCGADQREADEAPVVTSHRGRVAKVVVEVPVEEPEFPPETEEAADDEEEAVLIPEEKEEKEEEPEEAEEEEF